MSKPRSDANLTPTPTPAAPTAAYTRFIASLADSFDRWHDGIGYDVGALKDMTATERETVEQMMIARAGTDHYAVEVLAAMGKDAPKSQAKLRAVAAKGKSGARGGNACEDWGARLEAAHALAQQDGDRDADRTKARRNMGALLVDAVAAAVEQPGIWIQLLLLIQTYKPPEVVEPLLKSLLTASGVNAVQNAAMVLFLSGKTDEVFDWNHRPLFLEFNTLTEDRAARLAARKRLCELAGFKEPKRG